MARRLAGNVRSAKHKCLTPEELAESYPLWRSNTMGWTHPQDQLRQQLHDGKLVCVYSGGNFSTKTFCAVAIALRACIGAENWCRVPANVALCALSQSQGRGAFQFYLQWFLAQPGIGELVHNATKREGLYTVIEFCNGSVLDIITVGQGADLHQGARRSLIVFDEEPTYEVFEEGLFRFRSGMKSRIIFTMTPTHGRSWVWEQLIRKREELNVGYVEAALFENNIFVCQACGKKDEGALEDGEDEANACTCSAPDWTIPGCPNCGKTRSEWDTQLAAQSMCRSPDVNTVAAKEWILRQMAATPEKIVDEVSCGRCWTYGVWPRLSHEEVVKALTMTGDEKRNAMRFCGWWEELDGTNVISQAEYEALKKYCRPPDRVEGPVRIWEAPNPKHPHSLGVDMSRGTGGDEIAMQALDCHTGHQVAMWADNSIPWAETLEDCADLGREYNALIVPETASTGDGLVEYLKNQPDLNLYHYRSPDRHIRSVLADRIGFAPSPRNSDRIRQNLIRAIKNSMITLPDGSKEVVPGKTNACYILDLATVEQLGKLFYDEKNRDGKITKPDAPGVYDDRVDALALAWEGRCHPDQSTSSREIIAKTPEETLWRQYERQVRRYGVN